MNIDQLRALAEYAERKTGAFIYLEARPLGIYVRGLSRPRGREYTQCLSWREIADRPPTYAERVVDGVESALS